MTNPIIGIDLGTTNSEVAVINNGEIMVINENGQKIIPSAVGLSLDGTLLIGQPAKNQQALQPNRTILSIKRLMGTQEKIQLGNTSYLPQEISALILKKLKAMAEAELHCAVSKAVITVPAYFSDMQRQATREAGELAGLEVVRIINEPTAAALAYAGTANHSAQKTVLVYDLGGGTFDVSIVSLQADVVEVLASTGNNHLGGDDFDAKIIAFITTHLTEQGIDISQAIEAKARIRHAAEKAKIILSDHPFALIEEEYLLEHAGKPFHLSLELSRQTYQELILPYIEETLSAVHTALATAKLMPADIDEVLLVGGSTRTPMIADKLAEIFGERPHAEIDPELCVATGAAIQAGIIAGERCNTVLVDITPYTFGMSYLGLLQGYPWPHVYKPLIQKNTPIPVTKSEVFFTTHDNQEEVEVNVYQGEQANALDNIAIGKFIVAGLRKVPAGNPIIVNFKLDLDGILQVTAKEKTSGLEKKLVISNAIAQFSEQEAQASKQRIAQLFADNLEEIATEDNTLATQSSLSAQYTAAQALMQKAQQQLNQTNAEDREDLINLIEALQDALNNNDEVQIIQAQEQLTDILFYLETNSL